MDNENTLFTSEAEFMDPAFEGDTSKKAIPARKIAIKLMNGNVITGGNGKGEWEQLDLYEDQIEEMLNDVGLTLWKSSHYQAAWAQTPNVDMTDMPVFLQKPKSLSWDEVTLFICLAVTVNNRKRSDTDNEDGWRISESILREDFRNRHPEFCDDKETRMAPIKTAFENAVKKAKTYGWIIEKEKDGNDWIYQITTIVPSLVEAHMLDRINVPELQDVHNE